MRGEAPVLLLLVAGLGCGGATLDRSNVGGSVETRVFVEEVPVHGAEVTVEDIDGVEVEGELLSVEDHALWILLDDGRDEEIPRERIRTISVRTRDGYAGWYAFWSALGAVSTLSHGQLAAITAPIWAVAGIGASAAEGVDAAGVRVDEENFHQLSSFARFPQGRHPARDSGPGTGTETEPEGAAGLTPPPSGTGER